MSIIHADSFNLYGTDYRNLLEGVYAEVDNQADVVADPDGISTQNVMRYTEGFDTLLRWVVPTPTDVIGIAARWWMSALPAANEQRPLIASWRDNDNIEIGYVTIDTTGRLSLYMSQSGGSFGTPTLVGTTTSPVITAEGWWHIEIKMDTTTPRCQIKVEGNSVLDENASWTNHASVGDIYQIQWEGHDDAGGAGPHAYQKDLVVWDDAGSVNNDFLGKVVVYCQRPDADVSGAWTQSTGTVSYSLLDNNEADTLTYISAPSTPPTAEVVGMEALPTTVTSVLAVTTWVHAAKSDGGTATLQNSILSGTASDAGADNELTVNEIWWIDVSELDPNTASAWARTTVDASSLQFDRTS